MINIRCDWKQIQDHGISFNEYLIIVVMAKGSIIIKLICFIDQFLVIL